MDDGASISFPASLASALSGRYELGAVLGVERFIGGPLAAIALVTLKKP
jgi:hypothetical protein